jgi:MerR family transcriptional regulator, light-induced transcriptional regulator
MNPSSSGSAAAGGLTVSQLAERTGVPAGTLRMWEARYGFPGSTAVLPGGHRRYSERDADVVRAAIRHRAGGLSLQAAILKARANQREQPASIFAGLSEQRPELQPIVLRKRELLKLTRAIEDEQCARATCDVLIGSFQEARFYRQSERRWRELARTARIAVALADFTRSRRGRDAVHEVAVSRAHPLSREWSIVISSPHGSACLAAWEIPAPRATADPQRRFEVLWSPEPEVVHSALAVAAAILGPLAPEIAEEVRATVDEPVAPSTVELRRAAALSHRMIAYLRATSQAAEA